MPSFIFSADNYAIMKKPREFLCEAFLFQLIELFLFDIVIRPAFGIWCKRDLEGGIISTNARRPIFDPRAMCIGLLGDINRSAGDIITTASAFSSEDRIPHIAFECWVAQASIRGSA